MFEHSDHIVLPQLRQKNLPSGRVYEVIGGIDDGAVYPSITRILGWKPKPVLEEWKKRVGKEEAARVSARATVQGSNFHHLAECFLSNKTLPEVQPNVLELWRHLAPWLRTHVTRVHALEANVYSKKLGVAGRFDMLSDIDDQLAVVDFKTAAYPRKKEWIENYQKQVSFYACAMYELTGKKIKMCYLPIASPETLQVFEVNPLDHLDALLEDIAYFYRTFNLTPA